MVMPPAAPGAGDMMETDEAFDDDCHQQHYHHQDDDDDDDDTKMNADGTGEDDSVERGCSLIALLDLPIHSVVGIDGKSILLQRNDFVGIKMKNDYKNDGAISVDSPSSLDPSSPIWFHFVTAKAAAIVKKSSDESDGSTKQHPSPVSSFSPGSLTVGFIMITSTTQHKSHEKQSSIIDNNDNNVLIRRYNPQTEEVDSKAVDDWTCRNLLRQIQLQQVEPHRLLNYDQVVTGVHITEWNRQTSYISHSDILTLRGIHNGDKIIPGTYDDDDDDDDDHDACDASDVTRRSNKGKVGVMAHDTDGKSVHYPPIPVVDPQHSMNTHKHTGTKRFLSRLTPTDRTSFFMSSTSSDASCTIIDRLVDEYYNHSWQNVLGDVQLSFVLFINLQCLSSLEHWKDLIAMLSLQCVNLLNYGDRKTIKQQQKDHHHHQQQHQHHQQQQPVSDFVLTGHRHSELYLGLLSVLPDQLLRMGDDTNDGLAYSFLEDVDETGDNFLIPSIQRIHRSMIEPILQHNHINNDDNQGERNDASKMMKAWFDAATNFDRVVRQKFPVSFDTSSEEDDVQFKIEEIHDDDDERNNVSMSDGRNHCRVQSSDDINSEHSWMNDDDDDDGEDGPVVVSTEEVEASLARSAAADAASNAKKYLSPSTSGRPLLFVPPDEIRERYPILVAAIMPNEDILMTCARALDEQNDVSLVREAAAYLEDVEQYNNGRTGNN